ncbi:MAG: class I SAM-dependent methyltransferase [Spirochaetes bacterium]|nr:class I SAM-dependent methyltransferase [Spirochaetota bacterium]
MNSNKFIITDECRKNLLKYTLKAFSYIPEIDDPVILDIGCGTGVPTVALAENFSGIIYALDSDKSSLDRLQEKVNQLKFKNKIKIIHSSFNDDLKFIEKFDIILAEGFLNAVGFEYGLPILLKNLKKAGYFIIHDEIKEDTHKKDLFKKYDLQLIDSFRLEKNEWWDDYYNCLEAKIIKLNDKSLFQNEISEINQYKKDPEKFKSLYYILQNKN